MNSEKWEDYVVIIFVIASVLIGRLWGLKAARITIEVEFFVWCLYVFCRSMKQGKKVCAIIFLSLAIVDFILLITGFWL